MMKKFKTAISILRNDNEIIISDLTVREQKAVKDIKNKIGNDVRHMRNESFCSIQTFTVRPEKIVEYFKDIEDIEITFTTKRLSVILGGSEVYEFKTDLNQF